MSSPFDAEFANGYVPGDEPPGMEERAYKLWKESGGKVTGKQVVEEQEESQGRRAMDSELRVMGSILRTLEDLDQAAQRRVLNYLGSRFASTP